ncbi:hypothetical protein P154DRAFT_461733 [Amniculicola lignicola CBS 123094]|uniref:Uncharacterized protein n=1 Tax=Amniculicola lignicola CBS 123094 TaxID=1392246 RepID=A0A6A5WMS8_9PLEO|nr:hypothetical protein P154DRAFT_461733 [Amniculicola lignicola CBS 123094]
MRSPCYLSLTALSALLSLTVAFDEWEGVCVSYGIDFQDEQNYFINSLSADPFTCVSEFDGECQPDVADTLLVDPNGDEYLCSQVDTTPMNESKLSTCPILKNAMTSGAWMILVLGNNGDSGQPFAWQRDIYLDVGPQIITTYTPTITYNITSTPTVVVSSTSTVVISTTVGPTATFTVPAKTAKHKKTVTPNPVTTTATTTFTKKRTSWTKQLSVTTKTVTAVCTVPDKPGNHDKPCTYSPTLLHPAALVTPTGSPLPKMHRFMRKDRAADIEYVRARINAAKLKRSQQAKKAVALEERAPDAPTLTITDPVPVNTTSTYYADTVTTTESFVTSSTTTTTLPPVTVYSGIYTSTVTAPTPTRTRHAYAYTTSSTTITIRATFTRTTTVTPSASKAACKSKGGHFGNSRR